MIEENLRQVRENIAKAARESGREPGEITLIAVTKTHPPQMMNEAVHLGITDVGENKAQEVRDKYAQVEPVRWHLIGHLQRNKVKYIIDKVCMIHSVDSIELMDEIERQAEKHQKVMDILIQINISGEETKFGIEPQQLEALLEHAAGLKHVRIMGLMTIIPKTDDSITKRLHFDNMQRIFIDIQSKTYDNVHMKYLSMGMSGDYMDAIASGANMVRVGSAIFGKREYK